MPLLCQIERHPAADRADDDGAATGDERSDRGAMAHVGQEYLSQRHLARLGDMPVRRRHRVASLAARKAGERRYRSSSGPTTGSTEKSARLASVALIGED